MMPSPVKSICVVGGCGHVGLPLGMALAQMHVEVYLLDRDNDRARKVANGQMPFKEAGADKLLPNLRRDGILESLQDPAIIAHAGAVIICIDTADIPAFRASLAEITDRMEVGQLLILRSTVPPGTTQELADKLSPRGIHVACCPERITQGNSLRELREIPQIVGGCSQEASDRAAALFSLISPRIIHLSPVEAELAKLFCNAWRYVSFAAANQFWEIADALGGDFAKIRRAMQADYPRMAGLPRAGFAGGPCLPKDTWLLADVADKTSFSGLIRDAYWENKSLPTVLLRRLKDKFMLEEMTVGVLGVTFKPDSDDVRGSLSAPLQSALSEHCSRVVWHDPCVAPYQHPDRYSDLEDIVAAADLLIVATPHEQYRGLKTTKPVVDISGEVAS